MRSPHQRVGLKGASRRSLGLRRTSGIAFGTALRPGLGRSVGLAIAMALFASGVSPAIARAQAVSGPRAVLEWPTEPRIGPSFRAIGSDPAAPRALVLWRFDGAAFQRVAETRSGEDGRFDFGVVPLPLDHAEFAVAAAGTDPARNDRILLERALPAPLVADEDPADARLLVLPARVEGELLVSDVATGRLLARIAIETGSRRGTGIDLAAVLPRVWPEAIAIEHRLPDGRRSSPEIWPLAGSGAR